MIIKIKYNSLIAILTGVIVIQLAVFAISMPEVRNVDFLINSEEKVPVPILLYHSVLESKLIFDRYGITPEELENDLKYIQDNGYTTIFMSDLINYVYNDGILPEKPIILTFDDGYFNNYTHVYPLLQKYNMKAVMSIIGNCTDAFSKKKDENLVYSHASWDQINEMINSGCIEIQNHTYALHANKNGRVGAKMKKGESLEHYRKVLTDDIGGFQQLIAEKTGTMPNTFVYPYGEISKESVDILKEMGFKATLSSYGGVNYIKRDADVLFGLKRNNRLRGTSAGTFFKRIYKINLS